MLAVEISQVQRLIITQHMDKEDYGAKFCYIPSQDKPKLDWGSTMLPQKLKKFFLKSVCYPILNFRK